MAEIRLDLNLGADTDWRSAVRKRQASNSQNKNESETEAIRVSDGELVTIRGVEYWFEPDRRSCMKVLNLPRQQIGSFGVKKSIVNFYDYHRSAGTPDVKNRFINVFTLASTDTTSEGYRTIFWKNCCCKSLNDVRQGLYDYLETYVWPQKCSEVVDLIDSYIRNTSISQQEASLRDIIIGERYFNDLFYQSSLLVAEAMLTPQLIGSMLACIPNTPSGISRLASPLYGLITQLDEAEQHIFRTCLKDGQFERESFLRPIRYWRCSPTDLKTRILPLILFISNWSLVLGAYLTTAVFGALAFTIGE